MSKASVDLDTRELEQAVRQLERELGSELGVTAEGAAQVVVKRAQALMKMRKHGRQYGRHQASAPGEAPAILTGELSSSFHVQRNLSVGMQCEVTITNTAPHAADLEFGTSKVAPRPYLRPAVEQSQREVVQWIERRLAKAMQKAGR